MPKWLKWTLTILLFVGLTVGLYFVGFNESSKTWIQTVVNNAGWFGYVIYILIQIIVTTIFCFVPATTFTFGIISTQIFSNIYVALALSIIGCWASSIVMFLVGRYGGVKVVDWLVGKEDRIKAQNLISDRATVLVPVMLACPFFPDDAICMVSGMTKMNIWYFLGMSLITRSIGVSVTVLTIGNDIFTTYVLETLGNNYILWFLAINVILFDVYAIWQISGIVEKLIKKSRQKKENKKLEIKIEEEKGEGLDGNIKHSD